MVYVLYGVAERDPTEIVCMFFPTDEDRDGFQRLLPGSYCKIKLDGIEYENIEFKVDE